MFDCEWCGEAHEVWAIDAENCPNHDPFEVETWNERL